MTGLRRLAASAFVGLALLARPAQAQVAAGDKDISISGIMQTAVGKEKSSFAELSLGFEYFQTRRLAWRIEIGGERTDDGTKAHTETVLGAGFEWNWGHPDSKIVPFTGVEIEHFFDGAASTNAIAPNIGLRAFVSRNTSFDVAAYLDIAHDDGHYETGLQLRFGFSYYLGKDARR